MAAPEDDLKSGDHSEGSALCKHMGFTLMKPTVCVCVSSF